MNLRYVSSVVVNLCLSGMKSDTVYALQRMAIVSLTQMVPVNGFIILRMNSWNIWLMVKD